MFKKEDSLSCCNYKPVTLLNIVYIIYTCVLNNAITEIVEEKLSGCQMGLDRIGQLFEKSYEFNIELHSF